MLSLRKRLALAYMGVIVGVVALAAAGAHWSLARAVHGQLDAALLALAETELAMLPAAAGPAVAVHDYSRESTAPPSLVRLDRLVQIIDADGHPMARSANLGEATLPAAAALRARLAAGETVFETLDSFGEEPVRMVSVPVQGHGGVLAVQVAGSLDDVNHVVDSASLLFVVMGVALLLAVGAAGALLTRGAFRAIDEVVRQAHRIGGTRLGERLPHPGTRDEIGRLVDTLNEMLSRLEQGFEALRSSMEEVERLTLLVEELLTLARIDAGQERGSVEAIALGELVEDAVRRLQPSARERQVEIVVRPGAPVEAMAARGAVSLVLANLLDNAVKFSPPGRQVRVEMDSEDRSAVVRVIDAGPGIRQDEIPHLFERFHRGANTRSEHIPGVGLGLAISQAIAASCGGRVEAGNAIGGGAVFALRLPRAD